MNCSRIKVWIDAEADFLEVRFSEVAGYMKATSHDTVMERVDAQGHAPVLPSRTSAGSKDKPIEADLAVA